MQEQLFTIELVTMSACLIAMYSIFYQSSIFKYLTVTFLISSMAFFMSTVEIIAVIIEIVNQRVSINVFQNVLAGGIFLSFLITSSKLFLDYCENFSKDAI